MENWQTLLAHYMGAEEIKITHLPNGELNVECFMSATSAGDRPNNFYKLFSAFLEEYKKADTDHEARAIFGGIIEKLYADFNAFKDEKCKEIKSLFTKHKTTVTVTLVGEFEKVYEEIEDIIKNN